MNLHLRPSDWKARTILILVSLGLSLAAHAQSKLAVFTEAGGCKLLVTDSAVKRLKEIAAQGSVTWNGQCKDGLIEGAGVLRQEGSETIAGKTKKYAVFYAGTARKGLRQGNWRRETFEHFVSSPTFYTSGATLHFADGATKGKPVLLTITSLDQLTPQFRKFVIEAQADATPANAALRYITEAAAAVAGEAGKPRVADVPKRLLSEYFPRVTASSQYEQFGPEGLLTFQRPGWLSAKSPAYPQWILIDFRGSREVATIGILAEDGQQVRAPKAIRIESSHDGKSWSKTTDFEIPCTSELDGNWVNHALRDSLTGRYLRIVILANCGDPDYVTVRGLRFYD